MARSSQKEYARTMINRKLSGQKRLDALDYIDSPGARTGRLVDSLKRLPDLEPEVAQALHARLDRKQVGRPKIVLEPAQRELLCADRADGMTYQAIADKYGLGYGTAYDIARDVEVNPRHGNKGRELKLKRLNLAERKRLCEDRATGMPYAELAEKYNVSMSTAYNIARDVEITPQPHGKPVPEEEGETPMATRKGDSVALAKRCEDVGWEIQSTTRGIRVKNPEGKIKIIHLSFSDVNALEACERDLNRLGLAEAEEQLRTERSGGRLRALEADRRRNLERTEQMTAAKKKQQKDLLLKAAGPYLVDPEDVPITWFVEPHSAPWMRWVWMTPSIAHYLLENHNKPGGAGEVGTNRPQSEIQIRHYRDIIVSGQWQLTHQGMASDTTGMVQDGQHRLAAIVDASKLIEDLRVPVPYFVGMDPANFKAIDEGLIRTASQLFAMGGEKNGGHLRSALRLIIAFKEGDEGARNRWRLRNTNAQLLDAFERSPEMLRTAATAASSSGPKVPMSSGAFTALHYLLYSTNGVDNRFVAAFLHGITHGTLISNPRMKLVDDDPRAALRRTLLSFKNKQEGRSAQGMDQLGLGILAWNFMLQGRHRQNLRWPKGTEIPQVLICKDGVGAVPPRALSGEVEILVDEDVANSRGSA